MTSAPLTASASSAPNSAFRLCFAVMLSLFALLWANGARAQSTVWLQIEARPTLQEANERARAYAQIFPQAHGFALPSGWYAIALGPYEPQEAAAALNGLKADRMIPLDSYITDGREYRSPFWPNGGAAAPESDPSSDQFSGLPGAAIPPGVETAPLAPELAPAIRTPLDPATAPEAEPEAEVTQAPEAPANETSLVYDSETLAEARASEAALSREEKQDLQRALQWFDFYQGGIDGAYGPGTRAAMAAWQEAMALEATGILTSLQRATLIANHQADIAEFGFTETEEREAGISLTLPLAVVEFDRYEPPFVHYRAKSAQDGLQLILISQPGDAASFKGLYDILQTLNDMPADGPRQIGASEFRIEGRSENRISKAWAKLDRGAIKGWMLISTPAQATRDARILEVLEKTFRAASDVALDPGMVALSDAARRGLIAGLEVKRPKTVGTGFYITADGKVLTLAETVNQCGKITLDRQHEAQVALLDDGFGIAVLSPKKPLAPKAFARFQAAQDRIGAEVTASGYSYGERLPAPVLSYGTLEESQGLDGEPHLKRLALDIRPGDAGGPVFDSSGAVVGILAAPPAEDQRVLPKGTAFALSGKAIGDFLRPKGLGLELGEATSLITPEALSRQASAMTVLVSCWE